MKFLLVLLLSSCKIVFPAPSQLNHVKSSRHSESFSPFVPEETKELRTNPQNRNLSIFKSLTTQREQRQKPERPHRDEPNPWAIPEFTRKRQNSGTYPKKEIVSFSLVLEGQSSVTQYNNCCVNILKSGIELSVQQAIAKTSRLIALRYSGRLLRNNNSNRRLSLLESVNMNLPATNVLGKKALRSYVIHF